MDQRGPLDRVWAFFADSSGEVVESWMWALYIQFKGSMVVSPARDS